MTRSDSSREPVVVVGVDGSPSSDAALRWAAHQARLTGASIRAVTTWAYPRIYGFEPGFPDDYRPDQEAERALKEALARASDDLDGVTVHEEVVEGQPALVLTEAAEDADLVVIGSRGHHTLSRMILGSVSQYVATHATCPAVILRPPCVETT
ncbi:putative universal stress protein [Nostocoides japonicum T1-X7]|uniref:Putative universal stress protein n=1 Tax=Nostocoides japonicum T1-X7 TaxID=1194083 RepID=A0A077LYL3_9MICO|nr:universal stress protein [Tetrasphaera japonica]CCH78711.1 putative universal stress protein [Tetrasphaera japonica T1-X7]